MRWACLAVALEDQPFTAPAIKAPMMKRWRTQEDEHRWHDGEDARRREKLGRGVDVGALEIEDADGDRLERRFADQDEGDDELRPAGDRGEDKCRGQSRQAERQDDPHEGAKARMQPASIIAASSRV